MYKEACKYSGNFIKKIRRPAGFVGQGKSATLELSSSPARQSAAAAIIHHHPVTKPLKTRF